MAVGRRELRSALADLVLADPGLLVVGAVADGDELRTHCASVCPDVVLLDVTLPPGGGLDAAQDLLRSCPDTKIVAVAVYEDPAVRSAMAAAGSHAFVVVNGTVDDLLRTIRAVHGG